LGGGGNALGRGGAGEQGLGGGGFGGQGNLGRGGAGEQWNAGGGGQYVGRGGAGEQWHLPTDGGLSRFSNFSGNNFNNFNHNTNFWNNNSINNFGNNVRTNVNINNYNCFHGGWYGDHPGAWYAAGWATGAAWTACTWGALAPVCGIVAPPVYYDYGNTVVYQGGNVMVNGTDAGTQQEYSQQASALAQAGAQAQAPPEGQWTPLGVFALTQGPGGEQSSNNLFQLAVNQSGIIRGNYYDAVADQTTAVQGSVDSKTQRACWTVGDKQDRVFDTGIYNLTKDQAPILVHTGNDQTQQMLLVRLKQPDNSQAASTAQAQ
jgi:hypothetical protein